MNAEFNNEKFLNDFIFATTWFPRDIMLFCHFCSLSLYFFAFPVSQMGLDRRKDECDIDEPSTSSVSGNSHITFEWIILKFKVFHMNSGRLGPSQAWSDGKRWSRTCGADCTIFEPNTSYSGSKVSDFFELFLSWLIQIFGELSFRHIRRFVS